MPIVRVLTLHERETAELQWTLRDGRVYIERFTLPPRDVVGVRLARSAVTDHSQPAAPVEDPPGGSVPVRGVREEDAGE